MYKQASLVQRHLLTLFAPLLGCAHLSADETAARFRELSRHEAELARAEASRLDRCEPGAAQRICAEADAICTLSKELRDPDAETRCLRSRDACQTARCP